MAGARPHRGREPSASSEFRLSLPGLGPRSGRGGLRAHFLTRLRVALKGQLSGRASGPPAASKSAHLRQAGARRHECTCVHGPALFWDSPEAREGVAERTVGPPDSALEAWLVQGPGAHPRGALGCTWQRRPRLHLLRGPPQYDFLLAVPIARHVGLQAWWGGYPGNTARRPFALSKADPVFPLPPQPSWDASVLLPSLASPLRKLHSWLCGSKQVLPEGVGGGTAKYHHYWRRVPLPIP
ncbi:hypothetical protein NN561_009381 [Cricetulus griseus]